MEVLKVAQNIFRFGAKIINSKTLSDQISEINNSIQTVYKDISKASLSAALESLNAANLSKNPESEIRAALHHLYDAYFVLFNLLTKMSEKKSLFGSVRSKDYVEYKDDIYIPCCKIAFLIYLLYDFLDESENAKTWKNNMRNMYNKTYSIYSGFLNYTPEYSNGLAKILEIQKNFFRNIFLKDKYEISNAQYFHLQHINKKYSNTINVSMPLPNGQYLYEYIFYVITNEGVKYINNTLQQLNDYQNR